MVLEMGTLGERRGLFCSVDDEATTQKRSSWIPFRWLKSVHA
jgi:hypothetical protein